MIENRNINIEINGGLYIRALNNQGVPKSNFRSIGYLNKVVFNSKFEVLKGIKNTEDVGGGYFGGICRFLYLDGDLKFFNLTNLTDLYDMMHKSEDCSAEILVEYKPSNAYKLAKVNIPKCVITTTLIPGYVGDLSFKALSDGKPLLTFVR